MVYMGGCQNYGPLLGPLNTRCHIILETQKGTMILTTTHMNVVLGKMLPTSGFDTLRPSPLGSPLEPGTLVWARSSKTNALVRVG